MWLRQRNVKKKKDVCPFLLLKNSSPLSPLQEPQPPFVLLFRDPGLLINLPRNWLAYEEIKAQGRVALATDPTVTETESEHGSLCIEAHAFSTHELSWKSKVFKEYVSEVFPYSWLHNYLASSLCVNQPFFSKWDQHPWSLWACLPDHIIQNTCGISEGKEAEFACIYTERSKPPCS